tara:strand:- start:158 stop:556 length:399 start_codon:yes stop_codon:yes gene_type:complete
MDEPKRKITWKLSTFTPTDEEEYIIDVDVLDICKYIMHLKDNEDLVRINETVKTCFQYNASILKHGRNRDERLEPGDTVRINGSGKIEKGKVIKVNRTRAVVECFDKERQFNVKYNVPFTMITKEKNYEESV